MGSQIYAKGYRQRNDNIIGIIFLEMLGCYSNRPSSQHYPPEIASYYPKVGNFISFVANQQSKEFLYNVIKTFREFPAIPSEGIIALDNFPDIAFVLFDHASFWRINYFAIIRLTERLTNTVIKIAQED